MYPLLITLALGIRNTIAVDKFDLNFVFDKGEEYGRELRIKNFSPISYHHSVKIIQNFGPPVNKTNFMQNTNDIERSPRLKILFISNPFL